MIMKRYATIDEAGFFNSTVTELALEHMPDHVKDKLIPSVPIGDPGELRAWAWDGSEWVAKDSPKGHVFYNPAKTKERHFAKAHDDHPPKGWKLAPRGENIGLSLDEVKEDKWAALKRQRNAAEFGTFTWQGKVFQADALSQSRIMRAASLAQLSPNKLFEWTLADDSTVTLTADDMIAVAMVMSDNADAVHAKGKQLRAQINKAKTAAEVEAVVW